MEESNMAQLQEQLLNETNRAGFVDDCVGVVEAEVASKSGMELGHQDGFQNGKGRQAWHHRRRQRLGR